MTTSTPKPTPSAASASQETDAELLWLTPDEKLLQFSELLFFAYRDFTGDPDAILQGLGFGRAHHRVLHFVNRQPGLRVADLLDLLNITKQSLGRVLRQLIDTGYIHQEPGSTDRRERLLFPTAEGRKLAKQLAAPQLVRLAAALKAAGPDADVIVKRFLEAMANAEQRDKIAAVSTAKAGLDGETSQNDAERRQPDPLPDDKAAKDATQISGRAVANGKTETT